MKNKNKKFFLLTAISLIPFSACAGASTIKPVQEAQVTEAYTTGDETDDAENSIDIIEVTDEVKVLTPGLSVAEYRGDDLFDAFLEQGGADSDGGVLSFLLHHLPGTGADLGFHTTGFGCSTISVPAAEGEGYYFGRNFDWNKCDALILLSYPVNGYASVSTVNTDFIRQASGLPIPDDLLKTVSIYAPLDGMNETGLCVSVNMIQDHATIDQNTDRPDVTTTTAIRLLLNKATTTEEALALLESYDMHASFGYMIHFAIADAAGNAVDVEYIDNEMSVIETPILTNYYLTEGEKYGIGTEQSHTRFDILQDRLNEIDHMRTADVRDTLSAVSKGNFGEFESTEWSVIFDEHKGTATYYHRENYDRGFSVQLNKEGDQ